MKTLLLAALLAVPAWGQSLDMDAASRKLAATLKADQHLFPEHWKFVMLNEHDWNARPESQATVTVFSLLDNRTTVIRAKYVLGATPELIHHSLAHEAGHAACGCSSEGAAEAFAAKH